MNELATQARPGQFDLSPQTFDQALTFAKYLAESEMVPKQFRGKQGDCLIAMQWGYEVNLKPLQALQNIAVINGKPGIFGDAGRAILLAAGCDIDEDDMEIVKLNSRARCRISRPGRTPVERTFSLEDAKTAGLWGKDGPWKTYPYRQMAWRAFWFAARDAASDLLRGMGGAEELVDIQTAPQSGEKNMGAVELVQQEKQALPGQTDEEFAKNMVIWTKVIKSKKKDVDGVLATVATVATLTDAQIAAIKSIPAELAKAEGAKPTGPTFAQVADAIAKATDEDALDVAASLITAAAIPDEQQRKELLAKYDGRRAELNAD
jgi:hypothetical protein